MLATVTRQGLAGRIRVLVTHDWSAIVKLCETAHVLEGGRLKYSGPAERAVRWYLYGDTGRSTYREGYARFVGHPRYRQTEMLGADFKLTAEVD